MTHGKAGKGDRFRPVNRKKYAENYDRIFGKKSARNKIDESMAAMTSEERERLERHYEIISVGGFQKFPKIPRLYRDIIITEKIDGTNAQVFILSSGEVIAGSRNRFLLPNQPDNYGFRAWVEEHAEELRQLGPGRHFGEWWGRGINRGYELNERRFSLFNVSRWTGWKPWSGGGHWGIEEPSFEGDEKRQAVPMCCHVVPILYAGPFSEAAIVNILNALTKRGSVVTPGFMKPEGIVIYHTHGNCCFKITLENDEKPKG